MRSIVRLASFAVVLVPISLAAQPPAGLVLRGGRVITMDDARPEAAAIATRGDRIVAVGRQEEIDQLIGGQTRVIELDGRTVVPGFIEGHGHFISLGRSMQIVNLSRATSWEEIIELVAEAAERAPPGQWIVGRGWHQAKWTLPPEPGVQGYPVHAPLSARTPQHPVLLTHGTGHMVLANARAMQLAAVDAQTPEVGGGEILRTANGEPTGVFRENAMRLVSRVYNQSLQRRGPRERRDELLDAIRLASEHCLEYGVTSFQDAGSSFADVDLFRELAAQGALPVRLWVMLNESNDALAARLRDYRMTGFGQHHLTVRAIKRMIDGALGTHGAWLLDPYDDLPGSVGHNTTSRESLRQTVRLALEHDVQLCIHAIGDRANREVLDLFEHDAGFGRQASPLRWRIEHAQHLHPGDIPRFAQLGVIASMQGVHCTSDAPFVVQRLGQRRATEGAYAWRRLLDAGAVVINGTDAPVESLDPARSFYASVTRKLPSGVPFVAEQRMTRQEALRSYTRDAAYAAFEEDLKGTLSPGKLADMVVLSHDPLRATEDELRQMHALLTVVGGRVAWERPQR